MESKSCIQMPELPTAEKQVGRDSNSTCDDLYQRMQLWVEHGNMEVALYEDLMEMVGAATDYSRLPPGYEDEDLLADFALWLRSTGEGLAVKSKAALARKYRKFLAEWLTPARKRLWRDLSRAIRELSRRGSVRRLTGGPGTAINRFTLWALVEFAEEKVLPALEFAQRCETLFTGTSASSSALSEIKRLTGNPLSGKEGLAREPTLLAAPKARQLVRILLTEARAPVGFGDLHHVSAQLLDLGETVDDEDAIAEVCAEQSVEEWVVRPEHQRILIREAAELAQSLLETCTEKQQRALVDFHAAHFLEEGARLRDLDEDTNKAKRLTDHVSKILRKHLMPAVHTSFFEDLVHFQLPADATDCDFHQAHRQMSILFLRATLQACRHLVESAKPASL